MNEWWRENTGLQFFVAYTQLPQFFGYHLRLEKLSTTLLAIPLLPLPCG
jgi:hypothetical protein